jgi:transcriptional regulator with XRE-family HTH domain
MQPVCSKLVTRTSREKVLAEAGAVERTRLQGARLRRLREYRDMSKSELSSRLGFGTTQAYDLYERGASIIRLDRIDTWAAAFEMPREDFLGTLNGSLEPWVPWTFRGALHGIIPDDLIDQLAEQWEGKPLLNQQAAARGILQLAEARRGLFSPLRNTNAL